MMWRCCVSCVCMWEWRRRWYYRFFFIVENKYVRRDTLEDYHQGNYYHKPVFIWRLKEKTVLFQKEKIKRNLNQNISFVDIQYGLVWIWKLMIKISSLYWPSLQIGTTKPARTQINNLFLMSRKKTSLFYYYFFGG